jgi:hypothetical protein
MMGFWVFLALAGVVFVFLGPIGFFLTISARGRSKSRSARSSRSKRKCVSRKACRPPRPVHKRGAALVEISARRRGDLGRRREIDDCFCALFWGNCEELGEPNEVRDHAAALITDAGRDETGMQAIGGDPRALQAAGEFARE